MNYLNIQISNISREYITLINHYNKLIKNKNDYLKKLYLNQNLDQKYLDILDKKIVEIPYYNQNEDREDHFTLEILVKIPESEYLEIMGNKEFMDDECRKKVFAFLRK